MSSPVVHWEIGGPNAEKLQSFYADLFGWSITPAGPEYWLVGPDGGGMGGGIIQTFGDMPAHVTIYIQVEDLAAALERAAELGGRMVKPPEPIPGVGSFALFEDPAGNVIGLMKMEPQA